MAYRLFVFIGLLLCAVACEPTSEPQLLAGREPGSPFTKTQIATRLAFDLNAASRRLAEEVPPPKRFQERRCETTQVVFPTDSPYERTVALGVGDARHQAKGLLPLDLLEGLTFDLSREGESAYFEASSLTEAPRLRSPKAAQALSAHIARLNARRYKAIFVITLYQAPRLVLMKGKTRRQWLPGILRAWLSVYDIDSSELLCQTEIVSQNSVDDEPIWRRLERETEQRLASTLVADTRERSRAALRRIAPRLRLPEAASGVTASEAVAAR